MEDGRDAPMFASTKPLPMWKVGCAIVASAMITTWCNVWLFRVQSFRQIETDSRGLMTLTLLANWLLILVVLVILLHLLFRLGFVEMGLHPERLWTGFKDTALVFVGAQFVSLSIQLVGYGTASLNDTTSDSFLRQLGVMMGQFFGNAFYEEAMFRGVVFSQFVVWLRSRRFGERQAACWGAIGSAAVFSAQHLPNRLMRGSETSQLALELLVLLIAGVFFAVMYWRTGNLWTTIGFHALVNSLVYVWQSPSWAHPVAMTVFGLYLLSRRRGC